MKFTILSFLLLVLFALNSGAQAPNGEKTQSQVPKIGKINWSIDPFEHAIFVENTGQFDDVLPDEKIFFEAKLGTITAYFTSKGILYKHEETEKLDFSNGKDPDQDGPPKRTYYYLTTSWVEANPKVTVDADINDKVSYYYTYPRGTHDTYFANIYKKITYHNLYPGIDVVYSFPEGSNRLKYTIVVHPGGDPSKIHLEYQNSKGMHLDGEGDMLENNDIGTLGENAPYSYYLENHEKANVSLKANNPDESFVTNNLDATKTLAIDPTITWTTNPGFSGSSGYDYAYDLDYDNLGNVYCYGGGYETTSPLQLVKLNPAGAIQWVYNATTMTSSTDFYGDFAVDKHSLECYTVEGWNAGGGARQQKISPLGALMATDPGNSGFNEMWRIQSTICPPGFVVFGNGTCCPDHACMLDTTMTTCNPVNIIGAACTTGYHDMALTAVDPFGGYALTFTTHSLSYGNTFDNELIKSPIPALAPYSFMVGLHYNFYEIGSIFYDPYLVFNAMNGLVCGRLWIYSYNGDTLKQVNRNTGAINRVTQISSTTAFDWGGLDVDLCDNIYVGNDQTIEVFDSTLNMTSVLPVLSGRTYDLKLGPYTGQLLYACGQNFISSISLGPPLPVPISITKGPSACGVCSGTATASAMQCGVLDTLNITYLWSDGETTRTASHLCSGLDSVGVSIICGLTYYDTVTIATTGVSSFTLTTTSTSATCSTLGSSTVSISGGTAPYTYSWSPGGQTTSTASGLSAGTYTVTVRDNTGCTQTASATITSPSSLSATITASTDILCNGGSTGTATVTASGGISINPYAYSWSPSGGTGSTGTGLSAGTYTVTVSSGGCTATVSVTITQPTAITATTAATAATCGNNNGSVTVTASGGTTPYTYSWSPGGQTGTTATGLSAGSYTVTITDNNGCTQTSTTIITSTSSLTASISGSTGVLCNGGNDGTATVNAASGTSPYTYLWASAGGTGATGTGLSAGTYTVTVTDNGGCTATAIVTITQPTAITASTTVIAATCGNSNGSATVTTGGGSSPYTYSWSPGGQTGSNATGLSAGTYTVTITDNNGCTQTSTAIITSTSSLTASISGSTGVLCNGGNDGTATVTAASGVSPYTYAWASAGGTNAMGTGLSAGTYTVTVTDNGGCTATAIVTITQPPPLTATMGVPNNVLCNGGATGSATVTAGGGTSPYTYTWTISGGSNATGTALSAGTYTVTITDNNSCTTTASVTITQSAATVLTTASTSATCGGSNGSATVTVAGGTSPYTYSWSAGGQTNGTATGLSTGIYTITVTDNNGCTQTTTATVNSSSGLTATITSTVTVSCYGGSDGSSTVTAAGGTTPYTYSWSPGGQTNSNATGLSAGTYTVTVTDNTGCAAVVSVTITQPAILTATIGTVTDPTCNGRNNGSANVTAGGGTSPYVYSWSPSGGTRATGRGFSAGTYTVTVTDNNGCTATASVTITDPPVFTATITTLTDIPCHGGTNGLATVTAAGGSSPYTYSWRPAGGNGSTISGMSAGTYSVLVTDNNGCTATAIATITQPPALTLTLSTTNISCYGTNNGSITSTIGGGTSPYTYIWSPSGGNGANASNLGVGTYTLNLSDANGCTITAVATITSPAQLSVSASGPGTICSGANASLTSTVSGGTLPYNYSWSSGGTTANVTVNPASTTTYTLVITDGNGCTATATVIITTDQPLSVILSGAATLCPGDSAILSATAAGGDGIYTYLWLPGNSTTTSIIANPPTTTIYTVELTDACGSAMAEDTATVSVHPLPDVNFEALINSGCVPLCVQFKDLSTVAGGTITQWDWSFSHADTTSSKNPIYCYPDTGTFSVSLTVTSNAGCRSSLIRTNMITVYPLPKADFTYSPQPIGILSPTVQFTSTSSAKYPIIYTYWNFGDGADSTSYFANPQHTYSDTGTYCVSLMVENRTGCIDSITNCLVVEPDFTLYIPNAFTPNADGLNETFMPKGSYIKDYDMYIFDRWEAQIFHSNEITTGWNGRVNGSGTVCQEGTYLYLINITDAEGKTHSYTGMVTLIR